MFYTGYKILERGVSWIGDWITGSIIAIFTTGLVVGLIMGIIPVVNCVFGFCMFLLAFSLLNDAAKLDKELVGDVEFMVKYRRAFTVSHLALIYWAAYSVWVVYFDAIGKRPYSEVYVLSVMLTAPVAICYIVTAIRLFYARSEWESRHL